MKPFSITKAAAVAAALLAPSAAAAYVTAPLPAGFLSSPRVLWFAANSIVLALWLLSASSRHHTTASSDHTDVSAAVRSLYAPAEHDVFATMVPARHHALNSDDYVSKPSQESRTAKAVDRPRVRKKSGVERPKITDAKPDNDGGNENGDDDDVSMDSMWRAIMQRGAARPVTLRESATWGNDELPRLERVAEKAVARKEMRKSATRKETATSTAAKGWRTRDVLVMAQDELLRRTESLIRRHHEHLWLQRQESEQRRALELHRRRRTPIYSV